METLYIVIPAYNEEENIEQCVNDWYPVVQSHDGGGASRLVVVNDGSRDHTYEKLLELAESRPMLMPLTKQNGGHGSAVLYGYRYAAEQNADWIFQTDSDCQTIPAEFQQFWDKKDDQEAIIGFRPDREDGKDRKFVENVVCFLLKIVFGVKVKDANAPFRLMRSSLVRKYIDRLPQDFNLPNIMFTTFFVFYGEKVTFLEVSFGARHGGTSRLNVPRIAEIGWQAMRDFARFRKEM